MRAMYQRGGDNPYAVQYDADQKKNIESVNNEGQALIDKYDESNKKQDSSQSGGFMSKAKSFSF